MPQAINGAAHPGPYIRKHKIPAGMSVTEAARRLGVGRPALSNLLNGNASLSPDMAVRLERAFGADRQELLKMQREYDGESRQASEKKITARAYVPAFLTIKARRIHAWANGIGARQLLPVLLRRLVRSTGQELSRVDFPGYDNSETKGPDGQTVTDTASPWVPLGKSYWEFGVSKDPGRKAAKDYMARSGSVPESERRESTFIFVTPRQWPGKNDWVARMNAAGDWKHVRAYDASGLEQWLEESIPAQMWFAEVLGMEVEGLETLEGFWDRWSSSSNPNLSEELFEQSVSVRLGELLKWLKQDPVQAFVIAGDSKEEALAFLACLFKKEEVVGEWGDLPVIFRSVSTLRKLEVSTAPFIPIVHTDELEKELGGLDERRHCIVVRPRNSVGIDPERILDRLGYESFLKALETMGFKREEAAQLARESARSPTILRRRLARLDAVRLPSWAKDTLVARTLVPMVLVGVWHAESDADRAVVCHVGDKEYEEFEREMASLLGLDDSPVWSRAQYRGVVSKIDALFAVSGSVTRGELNKFLLVAENVLSEADPALDLPEDKRWAANLYGKVREHSGALRASICETLVILSVHGDNLFRDRLGISVEAEVDKLVRKLLEPLSIEKLLSQDDDLPRYAEAAPEAFLELISEDLAKEKPVVFGLLKPADSGPFGGPSRTGLLWALECLAWKQPEQVSPILARMSEIEIGDNWANKPINSLRSIFRCWMPQTAAFLEERVTLLELLVERSPDAGWQICMDQLITRSQVGGPSYRPRWRSDASGAGQIAATIVEIQAFCSKALELALDRKTHNDETLGDLVERIHILPREARERVWQLIDDWARSEASDDKKQTLAKHIHRFVLTRPSRVRQLDEEIRGRARVAWEGLRSGNAVIRHAWLFADRWMDLSAEDLEDENIDAAYERHNKNVDRLRTDAIRDVWETCGFEGIVSLLVGGGVPDLVGEYLAPHVVGEADQSALLRMCLGSDDGSGARMDGFMRGFLHKIETESLGRVIEEVVGDSGTEMIARVFCCAPFGQATWRLLDGYGEKAVSRYWEEVYPYVQNHNDDELLEMMDRLLEAQRPRVAFNAVQYDWARIETTRLKRLLRDVATVDNEPEGYYQISPHHLSKAMTVLGERTGVSEEELAHFEFLYIGILDIGGYRIENLERQVFKEPLLFVQILALVFKRKDGRKDPAEWNVADSQRERLGSAGYRILDCIALNPVREPDGSVDVNKLHRWVNEARELCSEYGRSEIGDEYIGQLLAREDARDGSGKPSVHVCEVMERVASSAVGDGFYIGVSNSRGAYIRDVGGTQERELAAQYRGWAQELKFKYPFVGRVLEKIAASYDGQARWYDDNDALRDRLEN